MDEKEKCEKIGKLGIEVTLSNPKSEMDFCKKFKNCVIKLPKKSNILPMKRFSLKKKKKFLCKGKD